MKTQRPHMLAHSGGNLACVWPNCVVRSLFLSRLPVFFCPLADAPDEPESRGDGDERNGFDYPDYRLHMFPFRHGDYSVCVVRQHGQRCHNPPGDPFHFAPFGYDVLICARRVLMFLSTRRQSYPSAIHLSRQKGRHDAERSSPSAPHPAPYRVPAHSPWARPGCQTDGLQCVPPPVCARHPDRGCAPVPRAQAGIPLRPG